MAGGDRRHGRHRMAAVAACAALVLLTACGTDDGPGGGVGGSEAAPLAGETIDFVVPYEPGGGFDVQARSVAPYLEKCLDATVVVVNEPGASGMRATTTTAQADPQSNRIQIVNTVGLVAAQVAGAPGAANFDLNQFSWLGRVSAPPSVLIVGPESRFASFADVATAKDEIRFVAQGPGSGDYINTNLLQAAYGFPFRLITGFAGAPEAAMSVVANDSDAFLSPVDTQLAAIQNGEVRAIATVAKEPDPLLPDVPTVYDTPPSDDAGKQVLDNLVALSETGRAVIGPPGMGEERLSALREGLACALNDEALLADLESQKRPLAPLGGEETAALVAGLLDSDESFRSVLVNSF
jgi:tripartite-type tricarboxylate transporter receptor subunit TctC